MSQPKELPKSSLRNNIMIAFFLTIVLLGVSITALSHHVLHHALCDSQLPDERIQAIGQQVTQMLTGFTLAGSVVAILIAALLSRTITEPLRHLLGGVDEISAGNLSAHTAVGGDDELGRLAEAFNDMAGKLKQSHEHLETAVEERTAELRDVNEHLQNEIAERWRAEEQLRRSEERFSVMANSAQDAILMMDPKGRITFYNKTAETMFGWPAAEAIGEELHTLLAPERFREAQRRGFAHFQQTGEGPAIGRTLELMAVRRDGTEFPIEISLAGVKLDREWHAIGIVRDITERKQVEEAIRNSEQRLQNILDSILAGVLIVDRETHTILDINESAARQVGLPKSEIVGKLCHKFVCPAECGKCPITDLGQKVDRSERVLCQADGTRMPIIKSVREETFHGRPCLLESFVDITEQKKAEAKLRESFSLLEATLEATGDAIYATDNNRGYKNYNNQFRQMWRLPDDVFDPNDRDLILATVLGQLKVPDALRETVMALRRDPERQANGILERTDGTVIDYCTNPQCINDKIVGRVWSFRDITEKYRTQQEQERLLRQVADINEELSHFAYVVSHDLKAPLRGIKMLAEWLVADHGSKLDDEARESFDLLQSRVERMHNLIEGILQYSRVGRVQEDRIDVDLNALLSDIVDAIAPPEHISIRIDGPLPTLVCEPTRIGQVFQNLLSNAVKYMDKPTGDIVIACEDTGDTWTFRVADNGPGIEEQHFDRIFKIFQTLNSRDEYESTGVGLTLVKKIVERCGGRIWVESEVGQGSTFLFTLPKQNANVSTEEPVQAVVS